MTERAMRPSRAIVTSVLATIALLFWSAQLPAAGVPKDESAIRHALNRLTFGPRPADVEKVRRTGLSSWIDQQLSPSKIDDHAVESRLLPPPSRPDHFDSMMEARMWGRESVQTLAAHKQIRAAYSQRRVPEPLLAFRL